MTQAPGLTQRLHHLADVVMREAAHLAQTDQRLFDPGFGQTEAAGLQGNADLAERVDAFVARFGRLQDTVGDKLLPALLSALAEPPGAAIDNLDKAEKLGLMVSADAWMEMRRLRSQMVHENIEDMAVLASALRSGHNFVPELVAAARRCVVEAERLRNLYPAGVRQCY